MATGDTIFRDDTMTTVPVMVGINGVQSVADSVVINFLITGEMIAKREIPTCVNNNTYYYYDTRSTVKYFCIRLI